MIKDLRINVRLTRRTDSLEAYFRDISKYHPLSRMEEKDLLFKIKNGDKDALDKLILHNLRFVISVAKQYNVDYMYLNDMINEGNCGLIKAAEKFDLTKDVKFISYAVWWIRQYILLYLNDNKTIRIPVNRIQELNKINKLVNKLSNEYNRDVDVYEVIESIGVENLGDEILGDEILDEEILDDDKSKKSRKSSQDKNHKDNLYKYVNAYKKVKSLDALIGDSEDFTILDTLTTDPIKNVNDTKNIVQALLHFLTLRQKEVVCLYFGLIDGDSLTCSQISTRLELTEYTIRIILKKSIRILKSRCRNKQFVLDCFNEI